VRDKLRNRRSKHWFWIDNEVIDSHGKQLGPYGVAIYAMLSRFADQEGECWPSLAILSSRIGISKQKAINCIKQLENLGLVIREQRTDDGRGQISTMYTLVSVVDTPLSTTETGPCLPGEHPPVHVVDTNYTNREQDPINKTNKEVVATEEKPQTKNPTNLDTGMDLIPWMEKQYSLLRRKNGKSVPKWKLDYPTYLQGLERRIGQAEVRGAWLEHLQGDNPHPVAFDKAMRQKYGYPEKANGTSNYKPETTAEYAARKAQEEADHKAWMDSLPTRDIFG
jgi:Helix-turn-helix domain